MNKIKVGDTFFTMERRSEEGKDCKVTKVGKKYFYLDQHPYEKFTIEGLKQVTNYTTRIWVYRSKEEYAQRQQAQTLATGIRGLVRDTNISLLSLGKLQQIHQLLNSK